MPPDLQIPGRLVREMVNTVTRRLPSPSKRPPYLVGALAAAIMLILAPTRALGQTRYSKQDLREDFSLLRSSLLEAHAGIYVYRSHDEIMRLFDTVETRLQDLPEAGFYATITVALAGIRDGHTLSLPSERWLKWYEDSAAVLPMRLRMVNGRAFVAGSAGSRIVRGSEVLAINGQSMPSILEELRGHLPLDGYAATGIAAGSNRRFELWYHLFVGRPDVFTIRLRSPENRVVTLRAPAVRPTALPVAPAEPPLALSTLDSATALLRIATFAADDIEAAGMDYATWLDSAFTRLVASGASNLIIDLRGNEGGRDTYGSLLLRHLMDGPFAYYRQLVARTDRVSFWSHTQLDSTFNGRFGAGLRRTQSGEFLLPTVRHQNLGRQQPALPVFKGRVWVLIDGGTFSTAAEFCALARSLGRATFVGEETGGTYEGNASGTFAILTLPHTGVRVVIPLVRYELAVVPPVARGRGVRPDYRFDGPQSLDDRVLISQVVGLITSGRSQLRRAR
jgi:hypothetical protein